MVLTAARKDCGSGRTETQGLGNRMLRAVASDAKSHRMRCAPGCTYAPEMTPTSASVDLTLGRPRPMNKHSIMSTITGTHDLQWCNVNQSTNHPPVHSKLLSLTKTRPLRRQHLRENNRPDNCGGLRRQLLQSLHICVDPASKRQNVDEVPLENGKRKRPNVLTETPG